MKKFLLFTFLVSCATLPPNPPKLPPKPPASHQADLAPCQTSIYNRGAPPAAFLSEAIEWAKGADPAIFQENPNTDIYSLIGAKFGPLDSLKKRKAAMIEALTVLAGYESSWGWTEGRDISNGNLDSCSNEEAGIFQTSYDSNGFSPKLKDLMRQSCASDKCPAFITCSKMNHKFAFDYTATLLRYTLRHHGPIIRRQDVFEHLRPACFNAIETRL